MTIFQLVSLLILTLLLIATIFQVVKGRLRPVSALPWSLLWIAAAVGIAYPELSAHIARAIGIQRGADLVLYSAVLAVFIVSFIFYLRVRRVEEQITQLVRQIALAGPDTGETLPTHRSTGNDQA